MFCLLSFTLFVLSSRKSYQMSPCIALSFTEHPHSPAYSSKSLLKLKGLTLRIRWIEVPRTGGGGGGLDPLRRPHPPVEIGREVPERRRERRHKEKIA